MWWKMWLNKHFVIDFTGKNILDYINWQWNMDQIN